MLKNKFLTCLFFLLVFTPFLFAEEITITTYYPSPYGSYNQLSTNRLAVGDTNGNGTLDAADQPNRDGDIRLKAQAGDPTTVWPAGTTGQFAYSTVQDSLYHYNGSAWAPSGGGGCYVSYSGSCLTGFTNKGSAGTYGACLNLGTDGSHFRPAGGSCGGGWTSFDFGTAVVCCL